MTKVELLKKYFFNRKNIASVQKHLWNSLRPWKVDPEDMDKLLHGHVSGEKTKVKGEYGVWRAGSYTPDLEGLTKWLCFDVDGGPEHEDGVEDTDATALEIVARVEGKGMFPFLERSGRGHGWHVWIFFKEGESAEKVRIFASQIIEAIPVERRTSKTGETKNVIEVFPKSNTISNYGNAVWLPWWNGGHNGGGKFYDTQLEPKEIKDFKYSTLPFIAVTEKKRIVRTVWDKWKEEALPLVDLENIYGDWLTGQRRNGDFLEARDPGSASGDRNPSAGVYDGTDGSHERGWFNSFRGDGGMDIFDFMVAYCGFEDLKEATLEIARMTNTLHSYPSRKPDIIIVNRSYYNILEDIYDAFTRWNDPPRYFCRGGNIVRLKVNDHSEMEIINEQHISRRLGKFANYIRINGRTGIVSQIAPLQRFGGELMPFLQDGLSEIRSVSSIPIYDDNLVLIDKPGFHEGSGIYFSPDESLNIPNVPYDGIAGLKILKNVVCDFPFVTESDRCHWIVGLLQTFVRNLINGPTPIYLMDAPTPGSGKTLLAKMMSLVIIGKLCALHTVTADDNDEIRKKITTVLGQNSEMLVLDNLSGKLNSSALASLVTHTTWTDRILGTNNQITIENKAVMIITSNNLIISEEMGRRMARIRIEPDTDSPGRRDISKFVHPSIEQWILQHRGEIIWACISIIEHWKRTGAKLGKRTIGSFEQWGAIMSGILESINYDHLMENQQSLIEASDDDRMELESFYANWWQEFGDQLVTSKELVKLCQRKGNGDMSEVRGFGEERSQTLKLTKALIGYRDKVVKYWRMRLVDNGNTQQKKWQLKRVGSKM